MEPIDRAAVAAALQEFVGKTVYLHLETTNGAYAESQKVPSFGAFIRNAAVRFERAGISAGPLHRVGLKMELGWLFAEGLTHWERDSTGRLLMAGHAEDGKLTVALQLGLTPFRHLGGKN